MKRSKTLLLVEDEAVLSMNQKNTLEKYGYMVETAFTAEQAYSTIKEKEIDLILMDIDLGRGKPSGTEAAKEILTERDIPIVFLTSHSEKEYVQKAKQITNYGYVLKNAGEFVLTESIEMALHLFNTRKEVRKKEEKFSSLYRVMQEEVALHEIVYDAHGTAVDYRFLDVNPAFERVLGIPMEKIVGNLATEVFGISGRPDNMDIYADVAETGKTCQFELNSSLLDKYFLVFCFSPEKGKFATVLTDISKIKTAEQKIQDKEKKLGLISENAKAVLYRMSLPDETYEYINPSCSLIFGYTAEEFMQNPLLIREIIHPDYKEYFDKKWEELLSGKADSAFEYKIVDKYGEEKCLHQTNVIEKNEEGAPAVIEGIVIDITERKAAEEALRESEKKYRTIFNNSLVSLWEEDISSLRRRVKKVMQEEGISNLPAYLDGHPEFVKEMVSEVEVVDVNDTAVKCYSAHSKEEIVGPLDKVFDFSEESLNSFKDEIIAIAEEKEFIEREVCGKSLTGASLNLLMKCTVPTKENGLENMLVAITDITERKQAEETLLEAKANLTALIENTDDIIVLSDTEKKAILYNTAFKKYINNMFNIEAYPGVKAFDYLDEHERKEWNGIITEVLEGKSIRKEDTATFINNEKRVFDISLHPVRKGDTIIGISEISRDITKYKEQEQELQYKNSLLTAQQDSSIEGIVVVNEKDDILSVNRRFIEMWRIPEQLIRENKGEKLLDAVKDLVKDYTAFKEKIRYLYSEPHKESEDEIELTDGRTLKRYSKPLFGADTTYYGRVWFYRDITEEKTRSEEKEYLLKEMNHRIKNNLLMVSSFINLKETALGGETDLSDLNNQIEAIRLIHERLYTTDTINQIDVAGYVQDLLGNVFALSEKYVAVTTDVNIEKLSTKKVIPLGLIINEIATNALKYGYTDCESPEFSIEAKIDDHAHQCIITLSNNGTPFPEDIDLDNPKTLGLRLITALVEQLGGSIELKRRPHPVFTIRFPVG